MEVVLVWMEMGVGMFHGDVDMVVVVGFTEHEPGACQHDWDGGPKERLGDFL